MEGLKTRALDATSVHLARMIREGRQATPTVETQPGLGDEIEELGRRARLVSKIGKVLPRSALPSLET